MTEKQATALAKRALPCPFCGEKMAAINDEYGYWISHNDDSECIISPVQLMDEADFNDWNTSRQKSDKCQLKEVASMISDVSTRIGVAASPAWIKSELEKITRLLESWTR